jgi:hypothetical protein
MADQVCPLLGYFGVHACNLHLVGVAGWIFSGIALLMLMGISDHIKNRRAARRAQTISVESVGPQSVRQGPIQLHKVRPSREPVLVQRRPSQQFRYIRRRILTEEIAQASGNSSE